MKNLKKILLYAVALVLAAGIFAGCVGGFAFSGRTPKDQSADPAPEVPFVGGVTLTAEHLYYAEGTKQVKAFWKNDTDFDIQFGDHFCLDKLNDKTAQWVVVGGANKIVMFNDIAYMLSEGGTREQVFSISVFDANIKEGFYRIRANFADGRISGTWQEKQRTVAAEFKIVKRIPLPPEPTPVPPSPGTAGYTNVSHAAYFLDSYHSGLSGTKRYTTREELKAHPAFGISDTHWRGDGVPVYNEPFLRLAERYDDNFFNYNQVIIIPFTVGSGSYRHKISQVLLKDGVLYVGVTQFLANAEEGVSYGVTCDMKDWMLVLEVSGVPKDAGIRVTFNENPTYHELSFNPGFYNQDDFGTDIYDQNEFFYAYIAVPEHSADMWPYPPIKVLIGGYTPSGMIHTWVRSIKLIDGELIIDIGYFVPGVQEDEEVEVTCDIGYWGYVLELDYFCGVKGDTKVTLLIK